ncbi:MAG: hypothetical protein VXX45_01115 [Candidatus Thermoplasmatota archaeon]|nr:hypothetical protein [Candidatus Thermoplasmatota archaeon]
MARSQKKQRRRPRKKLKNKGISFGSLAIQLVSVLIVVFIVFFLIAAKIISNITGAILCMISLSILSYFIVNSPKKPRKKRRPKRKLVSDEPQFYTALPSTVGLNEVSNDFSTSEVRLPPRPVKAARRQREFVMYPSSVGSGDYSDSYTQIDKDTVLRLRGEMVPEMGTKFLPGSRLPSFPSPNEIADLDTNVTSAPVVTESVPVVAESVPVVAESVPVVAESVPVAAESIPVAAESVPVATEQVPIVAEPVPVDVEPVPVDAETPVVQVKSPEEETDDLDFDMEWE